MSVYGYIRVSDEKQKQSGLGIAAQKKQIEDYARRLAGAKYVRTLADQAVSARRKPLIERPRGAELDALLKAGDHVVIAKLDRAFRNLRDFATTMERWRKRGVYVHVLDLGVDTTTPVGELVAGIMAAVAQWESSRIGERIRDAQRVAVAMGRSSNGRHRVGFRLVRHTLPPLPGLREKRQVWLLKPCPRQRRNMALIVDLRKKKHLTWAAVAAELNRRRLKTGEGRPWSHQNAWYAYHAELDLRAASRAPRRRAK